METAYVSGNIEVRPGEGCFAGGQKIDCPPQRLSDQPLMGSEEAAPWGRDILPENFLPDVRNDAVFFGLLGAVAAFFALAAAFKMKIFRRTLGEYVRPIWYLVLAAVAVVLWQYQFGIGTEGAFSLRISQWVWEAIVALSIYMLARKFPDFTVRQALAVGVLYAFVIHGLKVTIRYVFYGKTLFYVADRFLYGGLLTLAVAFAAGLIFTRLLKKKA